MDHFGFEQTQTIPGARRPMEWSYLERSYTGIKIAIFGFGWKGPLYGAFPIKLERITFLTFSFLVPMPSAHMKFWTDGDRAGTQ
jgi:hypothetical protein